MSTPAVITVRSKAGETASDTAWTDDMIQEKIDEANGDLNIAVALIWEEKAAGWAPLVNMSESGSSRNMGDLYKNALQMADRYRKLDSPGGDPSADPPPFATRTRTRAIVRP